MNVVIALVPDGKSLLSDAIRNVAFTVPDDFDPREGWWKPILPISNDNTRLTSLGTGIHEAIRTVIGSELDYQRLLAERRLFGLVEIFSLGKSTSRVLNRVQGRWVRTDMVNRPGRLQSPDPVPHTEQAE